MFIYIDIDILFNLDISTTLPLFRPNVKSLLRYDFSRTLFTLIAYGIRLRYFDFVSLRSICRVRKQTFTFYMLHW